MLMKPYMVEIEPDQADKIAVQSLKEFKDAIEADGALWGPYKQREKDLKAIKRILKLYGE